MLSSTSLHGSVFPDDALPASLSACRHHHVDRLDVILDGPTRKIRWSPQEDQSLEAVVNRLGTTSWGAIAASLPGRTGKQCRERWTNQLSPNLSRDSWSSQEDALLILQQKICGNSWSKIAQSLPGRSSNSVKNRWCCLTKIRTRLSSNLGSPSIEISPPPPPKPAGEIAPPQSPEHRPPPSLPVRNGPPLVFPGFDWLDPALDPFADCPAVFPDNDDN
jgi:hypothetical protein